MWLAIGTLCLILLIAALYWLANAPRARIGRALAAVVVVILGIGGVLLLLTGKLLAALPALAAAGAALWRMGGLAKLFSSRASWGRRARSAEGGAGDGAQSSTVETAFLQMRLDHATGALDGEVRQGSYAGRTLSSLDFDEALDLLAEVERSDADGARLLERFLDREHGSDWRERAQHRSESDAERAPPGGMSRDEALEVLGLEEGADAAAVRRAHKELMLKLHPDRGGSSYLAAKLNQAKDTLLGRRRAG